MNEKSFDDEWLYSALQEEELEEEKFSEPVLLKIKRAHKVRKMTFFVMGGLSLVTIAIFTTFSLELLLEVFIQEATMGLIVSLIVISLIWAIEELEYLEMG